MWSCECENTLSPHLLRFLRAYKPRLQKYVSTYFQESLAHNPSPTIAEVQECIARAYDAVLKELETEVPQPDEDVVTQAVDDYREGHWQSIEDIIDEIPDKGPAGS